MSTEKEINKYYDQTYHQYRSVWKLDKHRGIHYGFWDQSTRNLSQAVQRMNLVLLENSGFKENSKILDMGCGVGGSSLFLAENINAEVTGININRKQIEIAEKINHPKLKFICANYLESELESSKFDGIWALETICHCQDKNDFIKEANRLLKPGGHLVLAEYFIRQEEFNESKAIKKWLRRWAIPGLDEYSDFKSKLEDKGFEIVKEIDATRNIWKSSLYMFLASFPGMLTTEVNQLFKDYGTYSHNHYKSAYWQFIALNKNYWEYRILIAKKL